MVHQLEFCTLVNTIFEKPFRKVDTISSVSLGIASACSKNMGTGMSSLGDLLCSSSTNMQSPNPIEFEADGFAFLVSCS